MPVPVPLLTEAGWLRHRNRYEAILQTNALLPYIKFVEFESRKIEKKSVPGTNKQNIHMKLSSYAIQFRRDI